MQLCDSPPPAVLATTVSALKVGVTEKKGACTKLRQQLEALERETSAKLAEMDRYNKDMQVRILARGGRLQKKKRQFTCYNNFIAQ